MISIWFFGTADFSRKILSDLYEYKDIEIKFVVSQPDKKTGRKQLLKETAVKEFATKNNIAVYQPEKLKLVRDVYSISQKVDFLVVVAYGKIMPLELLECPRYGSINLHGSLLPLYRWASPIQEAVKNWDTKTWLTTMFMSAWMDEWDILLQEELVLDFQMNAQDIFQQFWEIWANLLVETLDLVKKWELDWKEQEESQATYCWKIEKNDWIIEFKLEKWLAIFQKYKAYILWPHIYSFFYDKKIYFELCDFIKLNEIWEVWEVLKLENKQIWIQCSDWILILKKVKLEWKKSLAILDFINWNPDFIWYKF